MMVFRHLLLCLTPEGMAKMIDAVRQRVHWDSRQHGFNDVDDYLSHCKCRPQYRRATNLTNLTYEDDSGGFFVDPAHVDLLLYVLRELNISVKDLIGEALCSHPWDQLHDGDTLLSVLGGKSVETPDMFQYYVSLRDTAAKNSLAVFLRNQQRLELRSAEECASIEMPPFEAEAMFEELRNRRNVGMFVVVGSPVVNSLAILMARAILHKDQPIDAPAWFEWPVPLNELCGSLPDDPLILRQGKGSGVRLAQAVIDARGERQTWFPRVSRREALERFREGNHEPVEDAGILLLDTTVRPMLCLVAGHGGCATMAAMSALQDEETISRELADSHEGASILGPGRLMQVVAVKCTKSTDRPDFDDFTFNRCDWIAHTLRPPTWRPRRRN